MILQTQNCLNYLNPNDPLVSTLSPEELSITIRERGCNGCSLGFQEQLNTPVIYRGNTQSKIMLIGEGPGAIEDKCGKPFMGKAGQLLDRMFLYIGYDTNQFYLTNIIHCRPIATQGYKQNNTPTIEQCNACRPYLDQELRFINPKLIILLGRTAIDNIYPYKKKVSISKLTGTTDYFNNAIVFHMYHPAALLHSQKFPEKYQSLRKEIANHLLKLKGIIKEIL